MLFKRVVQSNCPKEKKAIAANLICQTLQRRLLDRTLQFDTMEAFKWANLSCEYGLFSHSTLNLVTIYDRLEKSPLDQGEFGKFTHVWKAYDHFREETGLQRPKSRYCANCHKKPKRGETLKRCSGHCRLDKKPVYCGRECQKEVHFHTFTYYHLVLMKFRDSIGPNINVGARLKLLRVIQNGRRTQNVKIGNTAKMKPLLNLQTFQQTPNTRSIFLVDWSSFILGESSLFCHVDPRCR